MNKAHEESLNGKIMDTVKGTGMKVNGSIATAFGCTFEGKISEDWVQGFIDYIP